MNKKRLISLVSELRYYCRRGYVTSSMDKRAKEILKEIKKMLFMMDD